MDSEPTVKFVKCVDERQYDKMNPAYFPTNGNGEHTHGQNGLMKPDGVENSRSWISKELTNIMLLGIGFMFCMGSYSTCAMSQYFEGTPTTGYNILCVAYASVAISFLLAPSISAIIGPKPALVVGAACLMSYVISFLRPLMVTLYLGSILQGLGQGLIWTVYGHFLTENSNKNTLGRNTGIFWCLFQSCLVSGNLYYFFMMHGVETISLEMRTTLFSVLTVVAVLGILTLSFMRHPWKRLRTKDDLEKTTEQGPLVAMVTVCKVAMSRNMHYLFFAFLYVGLELGFFINVYSTTLGYTMKFGIIRESLVGLNGVFIGVGQIIGGMIFAILGKASTRHGRDLGVLFGFFVHVLAYFLVYLYIPPEAPLKETTREAYFPPNAYVAMFCSTLLGLGDASWINQIVAILGTLYPGEKCLAAFAWFQFLQCFGASISFVYSGVITLEYQLLILVIFAVLGLAGFCALEWKTTTEEVQRQKALQTTRPGEKTMLLTHDDYSTVSTSKQLGPSEDQYLLSRIMQAPS